MSTARLIFAVLVCGLVIAEFSIDTRQHSHVRGAPLTTPPPPARAPQPRTAHTRAHAHKSDDASGWTPQVAAAAARVAEVIRWQRGRMTDLPEKVVLSEAREVAGCRHIVVGVAPFANEQRVALDIVDESRARCCARIFCRSHAACRLHYPCAVRLALEMRCRRSRLSCGSCGVSGMYPRAISRWQHVRCTVLYMLLVHALEIQLKK